MFKDLFGGKSRDVLSEVRGAGEDIGVFTLALANVEDPFDPDPLWDRRYGGNSEIIEESTEDRDFRLQAALDGCRDVKFVRDEAGRFREQTPVFTDVVVWVPEVKWRADAMHGGRRCEAFATNLAQLHKKKFMRSLPGDREPNYAVMPDDGIAENMIVFQFGFGVFVPNDTDVLMGSVRLRRSKTADPISLPDWSFWHDGAQIKRPVGVYQGQGSMLITPDRSGPVRSPIWFGNKSGNISVNLSAADSERVYADDENIKVVETIVPKKDGEPFQWVLKDTRPGGKADEKSLLVEVEFVAEPATERAEPPPPPPEPRPKKAAAKAERAAVKTPGRIGGRKDEPDMKAAAKARPGGLDRFFQETDRSVSPRSSTPISTRFSLKLSGCALLRIDGERALDGLEEWVIWLDQDGSPIQFHDADKINTDRCLALAATAASKNLFYRHAGETGFKPVRVIPCHLQTETGKLLDILPSPVPRIYHSLLLLRPEISLPLSSDPLVLGRSNLSDNTDQPDLPLELLNHPQSLRWAKGAGYRGAKLNSLNLSRKHVRLRLADGRLELALADGRMPVYVLDREAQLIKTLEPGERASLTIEPDEHFIVGSYLLRFHQEQPRTMMSRDATMLRRGEQPPA